MIADTPSPSYYAVIFTSVRTELNEGYSEMAKRMRSLAEQQEGFLGFESAEDNLEISISYWRDLKSIRKWKENTEHQAAQLKGRESWYALIK